MRADPVVGAADGVRAADLWRRRDLVLAFARRDIAVRFRGSVLGWTWSLLLPLATVAFFSVVFLVLFRVEAPPLGSGQGSSYAAFLFCGLVGWNLFAGLQTRSIDTLRSCAPLFGKSSFPAWTPVVGSQLMATLQTLAEFAVLAAFLLVLRNVGWTWLLAVPIMLGLALFSMGVGLVVGALSGFAGDVREIVVTVLGILYFATPVLYPVSMVEGVHHRLALLVMANPLAWYLESLRSAMYSLVAPPGWAVGGLLLLGVVVCWLGLKAFVRLSRDLADQL